MKSDIEIAQATTPYPIDQIASALGIPEAEIEPYGRTKAKVSLKYIDSLAERPKGKQLLVASCPTAGCGPKEERQQPKGIRALQSETSCRRCPSRDRNQELSSREPQAPRHRE